MNILYSRWLFLCRHHPSGLQASPWVHLWKSISLKTKQRLVICLGPPGWKAVCALEMTLLKCQWGNPCLSDYMHNLPGDNWGLYSSIHSLSTEDVQENDWEQTFFFSSVDGGRVGGPPFTYQCLHTWHSGAAYKQWVDSVRRFTDVFIWILQECLLVGGRSFWEGVLWLLRMFYSKHYGKPPTKDCQCIPQALIYPSRFASCRFWKQHIRFSFVFILYR